jgi:hypothetical protein
LVDIVGSDAETVASVSDANEVEVVTVAHDKLPAVDPAFRNLPLLVVEVAGTCLFPSPDG